MALISVGYVSISLFSVQFFPRIGAQIFWPASALCAIGLAYAMGQSGAFKPLGWVRFLIFLVPALAIPSSAQAKKHYYNGHTYRHYRTCRHSSGTTGLVAGGVGGALVGNGILGHGALGPVGGAVGGAFAGRAIDRSMTALSRCR